MAGRKISLLIVAVVVLLFDGARAQQPAQFKAADPATVAFDEKSIGGVVAAGLAPRLESGSLPRRRISGPASPRSSLPMSAAAMSSPTCPKPIIAFGCAAMVSSTQTGSRVSWARP